MSKDAGPRCARRSSTDVCSNVRPPLPLFPVPEVDGAKAGSAAACRDAIPMLDEEASMPNVLPPSLANVYKSLSDEGRTSSMPAPTSERRPPPQPTSTTSKPLSGCASLTLLSPSSLWISSLRAVRPRWRWGVRPTHHLVTDELHADRIHLMQQTKLSPFIPPLLRQSREMRNLVGVGARLAPADRRSSGQVQSTSRNNARRPTWPECISPGNAS